jgi:general secretion pathway protein F
VATNAAISLDELVALNSEIAALTRAGVPLERGLAELGEDMPGRLGRFARSIAERTGRGESLADVVTEFARDLPPVYLAVIRVGLRTGRLPAALEALAGSVRRLVETRRCVVSALLYPLIVTIVACVMAAVFASVLAPRLYEGFRLLDVPGAGVFAFVAALGPTAPYWGVGVPAVLIVLAVVWWYQATRAAVAQPRVAGPLLGWLPWLGKTLRWARMATFAELLALLLENRVPLQEAVVLAAEASGDRDLAQATMHIAGRLQGGGAVAAERGMLPPLLAWVLSSGGRSAALVPALKHVAASYRSRARHQADMAQTFLPVLAVVLIGGGIVLTYTVMLFLPYSMMLQNLGRPV